MIGFTKFKYFHPVLKIIPIISISLSSRYLLKILKIIKWMPIYFISRYFKRYKNLSMLLRSIREERIKFVLPAYFSPLKLHLPLYHGFFKSHIKYWWTRTSILEHGGCLIEPLPEDFSTFSCLVSPSPSPVAVEGYRLTRVNTSFQQQFEQWFNNV